LFIDKLFFGRLSLPKGEGEGEGLSENGAGLELLTFVLSPSARGEVKTPPFA